MKDHLGCALTIQQLLTLILLTDIFSKSSPTEKIRGERIEFWNMSRARAPHGHFPIVLLLANARSK